MSVQKNLLLLDQNMSDLLPKIRLLEASGSRAFPSTTLRFDGTWAIRTTAGHPAKRLNCVSPLDPKDSLDLRSRIANAKQRFDGFGRPLFFRLTPLAPALLRNFLKENSWLYFEESIVMEVDLGQIDFTDIPDQLPLQDTGRWVESYIHLNNKDDSLKPGMVEVINRTQPETGLFLKYDTNGRQLVSLVRCVRDRDFCGIFELATNTKHQRQGHGLACLLTALKWARQAHVQKAYLQVVADNEAAINLYQKLGFKEVYRYGYWSPPENRGLF